MSNVLSSNTMGSILSLQKLSKVYADGTNAVIDLDMDVPYGDIRAFLGPNGAGKSTTIGMLCGLCLPSAGTVRFGGEIVSYRSLSYRRSIGVAAQHINLELDLNVSQNLHIHGLLFGMSRADIKRRSEELIELAGLSEKRFSRVRSLSGGMKRKLQIIRALLHDPSLLILDEPTVGLDPASRNAIWDLLLSMNRQGKTIFFSTHYMEEAQRYSRTVTILNRGRKIAEDNSASLIKGLGPWAVELQSENGRSCSFYASSEEAKAQLAHSGTDANSSFSSLLMRPTCLEDVFVNLTKDSTVLSDISGRPLK